MAAFLFASFTRPLNEKSVGSECETADADPAAPLVSRRPSDLSFSMPRCFSASLRTCCCLASFCFCSSIALRMSELSSLLRDVSVKSCRAGAVLTSTSPGINRGASSTSFLRRDAASCSGVSDGASPPLLLLPEDLSNFPYGFLK